MSRFTLLNIWLRLISSWPSILEYLTREDAERAVKDLDGRDLRGRPVRVALDETVSELPSVPSNHSPHTFVARRS